MNENEEKIIDKENENEVKENKDSNKRFIKIHQRKRKTIIKKADQPDDNSSPDSPLESDGEEASDSNDESFKENPSDSQKDNSQEVPSENVDSNVESSNNNEEEENAQEAPDGEESQDASNKESQEEPQVEPEKEKLAEEENAKEPSGEEENKPQEENLENENEGNEIVNPLPPHVHQYDLDNPEWKWSEDHKNATVTFKCQSCDEGYAVFDAQVDISVVDPTRLKTGKTTYTATANFEGKEFREVYEEEIKRLPLPEKYEIRPRLEKRMKDPKGLDFVFFSERVQEYGEGDKKQLIYPGDDGIPYVDDKIILDADGLGGNSSMKHLQFKRELFEEDLVFDTLFSDMYGPKEENELLNDYTIDSFASFISIRNLYSENSFSNALRYKKSGHFGSRIASIVLLHQLLDKEVQKEAYEMFDSIKTARETENKEDSKMLEEGCLQEFASKVESKFKTEFMKAAENGNFFYEVELAKQDVLGTTMCATLTRENKDDVEAFYLLAGDSLPFVMNADGLFEVMHAHEGPDGGMTNKIHSNDGNFYLEPKYIRVKKPCILFNASDGVFDCKYFISPMVLEKLILDTICESSNKEEVANKLCQYFIANGTHDDSSTMAAKFFGFKNYSELKEFAQTRRKVIESTYLDEVNGGMPDLFRMFGLERNNLVAARNRSESDFAYEISRNQRVVDYYKNGQARMNKDVAAAREEEKRLEQMIGYVENEITFHSMERFESSSENGRALAELDLEIKTSLNRELDALKRILEDTKTFINNKTSERVYKSFKEEVAEKGLEKTLETLIKKNVISEEEVDAMLKKCNISFDGVYEEKVRELEEKIITQKNIFAPYDEQYNSDKFMEE